MAVVLPMAASVHHPSLLSTATTWTTGASTTSEDRPHPTHQQNPHIRLDHHSRYDSTMSLSSPGRARSASTEASRTSSSPDSQASESPHEQSNRVGSVAGSGGLHNGGGSTSTSVSALGSMSMPAHRTRRPRRRADEVERLYKCTWNGCEKSYGTLSHLNDHVRLQRHGNKREPHEFKEARRIWRQERKSRRLREHAHAMHGGPSLTSVAPVPMLGVAVAPASGSLPSTSPAVSGRYRNITNISVSGIGNTLTALGDDSSPEDEEADAYTYVDVDFDRSRTPVVSRVNALGPRIAAASDYHDSSLNSISDSYPNQQGNYSHRTLSQPALRMQHDPREPTVSYIHENGSILSPRRSTSPTTITAPLEAHKGAGNGFRLPSIAELRLDLSLDEYEAHAALGSLSSASVTRPNTAGALDHNPPRAIRHRKRDSWNSPSTSSTASLNINPKYPVPVPYPTLVPPPPFHLYHSHNGNGNDPPTDPTRSPDYTNQYRFRVLSSSSAATSPSMERPSSRSLGHHTHSHAQYPPYSRSNSRTLSTSRPSSSATTTTQAYMHSTPTHPPSSFPFIPAQPPRMTPEASEGEPRRKRRKYEEIERRYPCGWQGCLKAYGTLNHLNDHVSLQGHGPKRRASGEFTHYPVYNAAVAQGAIIN